MREHLAVDRKKELLSRYLPPRVPARILDVGCGAGGYLLAASELGFDALGVEPSESHATMARSLGLDVRPGYFTHGMFPPCSFDLVLTSHVVEHILEPRPFLASLAELVKPGGWLVAITPDPAYLGARLSGRFWVMLKPIDHVSMLTERAFRSMRLEEFGVVSFRRTSQDGELFITLAAAARDALTGVHTDRSGGPVSPATTARPSRSRTKKLFARIGAPVDRALDLAGRGACLILELRRS